MSLKLGIQFELHDHVPACEAWMDQSFPHFYALNFAHSGRIRWAMNSGKLVTLPAPVAWWTIKGTRPRYRYGRIGQETWDHYFITLNGPAVGPFFRRYFPSSPSRKDYAFIADPETFRARWQRLFDLIRRGGPNHHTWAVHELEGIALQINQPLPVYASAGLEAQLEKSGLAIRARPQEEWSWEAEATRLGMSLVHFRRSFRKVHGVPPHHFLLKVRMETAAHRLSTTSDPVKIIAEEVGLPDIYHFSKQFKARFHLPPATYRREMRGLYVRSS